MIGSGLDHKEIELLYVSDVFTDINFHGWLDDREHIDQLISHADLAVFPSQENGPEGIPRVIEEALMIGVPVLITPHTVFLENNLNELVALVASGFDVASLKAELLKMLRPEKPTCSK